jgi:hypothetical protein
MRIKHELSFSERLAEHAKKISDQLANLPPGDERDALIEKLERTEIAIEISKALLSANHGELAVPASFRLK